MVVFWGRGQKENSKITWQKMEIMLLLPGHETTSFLRDFSCQGIVERTNTNSGSQWLNEVTEGIAAKYWTTRVTSITMCFALQTPATWVKAKTGDGLFSLVGKERHSWNVRTVKGKSLVSITRARLGKLETRLETVSYDFLFSQHVLVFQTSTHVFINRLKLRMSCTSLYICDVKQNHAHLKILWDKTRGNSSQYKCSQQRGRENY